MNKGKSPKDMIKGYLDAKAKDDALFAEMYKKPAKSINGCWAYIVNEAKKRGNAMCMTDEEVYGLAVHYYCEDDLKEHPLPTGFECKASTGEKVELSKEDQERLREEAEAEFRAKMAREIEEKERKRAEAEQEKKRERMVAKTEKKRAQTAGMGSLFDF